MTLDEFLTYLSRYPALTWAVGEDHLSPGTIEVDVWGAALRFHARAAVPETELTRELADRLAREVGE